MRIAVIGATGFIGSSLLPRLRAEGHECVTVSRSPAPADALPGTWQQWDGQSHLDCDGCDAILSLAGQDLLARRWNGRQRAAIRDSRVETTRWLVGSIARSPSPPATLIVASAIGYYGLTGEGDCDEDSPAGTDFLAGVSRETEQQARGAEALGVRVACLRVGIVLGRGGGALAQMLLPFRLGLGGPVAGGTQWMSWIHKDDACRLFAHAITDASCAGALNATAPVPVQNRELARTLGRVLNRPALLPVPAALLRLRYGEAAQVILRGRRVLPRRTMGTGFQFDHETLEPALRDLLQPD